MLKNKIPILTCKIAGVTFEGRQEILRRLLKGADTREVLIQLVPEPKNPHDSNAIKVLAGPKKECLGYVPRDTNEVVLEALRAELIHDRQSCTVSCTSRSNGSFIFWGSIRFFRAESSMGQKDKHGLLRRFLDLAHYSGGDY